MSMHQSVLKYDLLWVFVQTAVRTEQRTPASQSLMFMTRSPTRPSATFLTSSHLSSLLSRSFQHRFVALLYHRIRPADSD